MSKFITVLCLICGAVMASRLNEGEPTINIHTYPCQNCINKLVDKKLREMTEAR